MEFNTTKAILLYITMLICFGIGHLIILSYKAYKKIMVINKEYPEAEKGVE